MILNKMGGKLHPRTTNDTC